MDRWIKEAIQDSEVRLSSSAVIGYQRGEGLTKARHDVHPVVVSHMHNKHQQYVKCCHL